MTEPARTLPCPQCAQVGTLEYSEGHYGIGHIPPTSSWILEFWRCVSCKHLWTNFISLDSVEPKD